MTKKTKDERAPTAPCTKPKPGAFGASHKTKAGRLRRPKKTKVLLVANAALVVGLPPWGY